MQLQKQQKTTATFRQSFVYLDFTNFLFFFPILQVSNIFSTQNCSQISLVILLLTDLPNIFGADINNAHLRCVNLSTLITAGIKFS